ncbi:hypothetical protein K0M31_013836 [Melipona bicolor]|uniref:Uncharacterized protein n=1 Tax=Melipona bicolor TaxID=60889 RepID=A0AA40KTK2_9HYME|nr:hypothetical protein K0M31_013836 [Melipona bicolor]
MGKFCSCFSRFRAIFRPETVTDSPLKPICTKPECLPRPPAASDSETVYRASINTSNTLMTMEANEAQDNSRKISEVSSP